MNCSRNQSIIIRWISSVKGWLFGVNPSRVKPEIKAKLIEYQKDWYEVLWDYWKLGIAK
nr:phage antirepressor N-terminal domain-containing protein [Aggregatibacter actinomycetemcomitans]